MFRLPNRSPRPLFRTWAGAACALLALTAACSPPPRPRDSGPPPLCFLATDARGGAVRELRTEQWHELLARGHDASTGRSSGDTLRDCTGTAIRWSDPTPGSCPDAESASATVLPPRALSDDDVVIGRAPDGGRLVWLILERFDDGEGLGPVAQVEFTSRGAAVRRLGVLRARTGRARLRVETVGAASVLVAEGERCATPDDPSTCRRTARVLVADGPRFDNVELTLERTGTCVGPAEWHLARDLEQPLPSGWRRRFELNTTLSFEHGTMGVHEQVVVKNIDPRVPAIPPRTFRRVDSDRSVVVEAHRLAVSNTSLWGRVLFDTAAVDVPDAGVGVGAAAR